MVVYHIEERQKRNWRSFFKGHKSAFSYSSLYYTQIIRRALGAGEACFWQRQHVLLVVSATHNKPALCTLTCVSTQATNHFLAVQAANVDGRKTLDPVRSERKHVLAQVAWGDFGYFAHPSAAAHLHTTLSWEMKGKREAGWNTIQEPSAKQMLPMKTHTHTNINCVIW